MKLLCVATIVALLCSANADMNAAKQTLLRSSASVGVGFKTCKAALDLLNIETEWGPCDSPVDGKTIYENNNKGKHCRYISLIEGVRCLHYMYPKCTTTDDCHKKWKMPGSECVRRVRYQQKRCKPRDGFEDGARCYKDHKQCKASSLCENGICTKYPVLDLIR